MTFNTNAEDDLSLNQQKSRYSAHSSRQARGPLEKLLAFVLSAGLVVLAIMFSLAALAVIAIAGLVFAGWFWWKTRTLRQQVKGATTGSAYRSGHIIEGEVVRTTDATPDTGRRLP
ncbi:hypothetical protein [Dechloromonas sp. A34]|uniref:hypothetical protein n=1 Tax=Dechloromonas sp. A34 TaxID=447588 RepID=UPI00224915B9|nr:hypothetical protein [Dechloromonas sp. A34]